MIFFLKTYFEPFESLELFYLTICITSLLKKPFLIAKDTKPVLMSVSMWAQRFFLNLICIKLQDFKSHLLETLRILCDLYV